MMTIKSSKRLSLNRETLVRLNEGQLSRVGGGAGSYLIRCGSLNSAAGVCPSKGDDECATVIQPK
jgi:hypothetical protein